MIDPALFERGWERIDIHLEETAAAIDIVEHRGQKLGRRRPVGRSDYVLRRPLSAGAEPLPLAIIEAKRESLPPEHGLQQGKGYRIGHLHAVPFVFSSNGHQFVEYDEETGQTSEARPMSEFPTPHELLDRYLSKRELPTAPDALKLLQTPYHLGRGHLRYYQDAAIRTALEKIIRQKAAGEAPRVLLSLATGSGKTRIAASLLKKMFDARLVGRALFVCDRTELRDNGLGDFQEAFGTDAAEVDTRHSQLNAKVAVATFQTLDHTDRGADVTFFLKHYPPGYFDVIVIDECHRSAWGDWFAVLDRNKQSIQVGLTATPREIRLPESEDQDLNAQIERERKLLADNLKYFGEATYEYSYLQGVADGFLAPADLETYDLFHDHQTKPERERGVKAKDLAGKRLSDALTGQRLPTTAAKNFSPAALDAKLILPERVDAMCRHLFERLLATGDNDPLQKTIVFCASDHHADLVANRLNGLYADWCKTNSQKRVPTYAFKCMASVNGQALIPELRGRERSHIIATTKDLLTTGVNVPCVRNIVFFRYVQSPILFHQMIGRGTRIDEKTNKLMFRVFDYTAATTLFGADFITAPPSHKPSEDVDPPVSPPPPPPPNPIKGKGFQIRIEDTGNFNLLDVNGRVARVTPEQYRARLVQELIALVPSLADFRERWLDATQRLDLMKLLEVQGLLPEKLREAASMDEYDLFDVIAMVAYGVEPLTRSERAARFDGTVPDWFSVLPVPATNVLRAVVRQFEKAGTEALETSELWQVAEVKRAKGLAALKPAGNPAELLRKTKETLFAI